MNLDVSELVDALTGAGIRASQEAARLTPPGVWVQPQRVERYTLDAFRVSGRLVLVVPDKNPERAYHQLAALLAQVAAVVPVPSAALRTVLMPDGAELPGLEVVFSIITENPAPSP